MSATTTEALPQAEPGKHYSIAQWMELKSGYIQGKGTLMKLCNKLGINYETAKTKSCKEKWEAKQALWVKAREARLGIGDEAEPEQAATEPIPSDDEITTTEQQLKMVNQALQNSIMPRDIADLTKSKATLVETLHLLRHGGKPPTLKPTQSKPRQSRTSYPEPEPSLPSTVPEPAQTRPAADQDYTI